MSAHSERRKKDIILCAALLVGSLILEAHSYAHFVPQASRNAHRHPSLSDMTEQILPEVEIVDVVLDKSTTKENLVRSPDGKFAAFTQNHPDQSPSFRICFLERDTGKVYEVRGLPLPYRPFSDLVWINNRTLEFDRWSQPHYGVHYVVNVKTKKLVNASSFADEFSRKQRQPKSHGKKGQ